MIDPATFFQHGRVPCKNCGHVNDLGSSAALYSAKLSTPCAQCGFPFVEHLTRQMRKLMEMMAKDPVWREWLKQGRHDLVKQRLDELVPPIEDQ